MDFLSTIKEKVKRQPRRLVFPESYEDRMYHAAAILVKEKMAKEVIFVGSEQKIKQKAKDLGISLNGISIADPQNTDKLDALAQLYFEKRKGKDCSSIDEAKKFLKNDTLHLFFGALLLDAGYGDAMIAGAYNTTGDVLRAALRIVGVKEGIKTASSFFIMITKDGRFGKDGHLLFADCATVPNPNAEQLAEIAVCSAQSARELLDTEPIVAMLSFSTKGSATGTMIHKVVEATKKVKELNPNLKVDGEMQLDAALIEKVGQKKAPNSEAAGKANVLIFPDLNAGNIGYKLVERFADAKAIGPILQGFKKPVNDLSRGCSVDDIVNVSVIASLKV